MLYLDRCIFIGSVVQSCRLCCDLTFMRACVHDNMCYAPTVIARCRRQRGFAAAAAVGALLHQSRTRHHSLNEKGDKAHLLFVQTRHRGSQAANECIVQSEATLALIVKAVVYTPYHGWTTVI